MLCRSRVRLCVCLLYTSIQTGLDAYLETHTSAKIDYIHGTDVVVSLAEKPGNLGFILPDIAKNCLLYTST